MTPKGRLDTLAATIRAGITSMRDRDAIYASDAALSELVGEARRAQEARNRAQEDRCDEQMCWAKPAADALAESTADLRALRSRLDLAIEALREIAAQEDGPGRDWCSLRAVRAIAALNSVAAEIEAKEPT